VLFLDVRDLAKVSGSWGCERDRFGSQTGVFARITRKDYHLQTASGGEVEHPLELLHAVRIGVRKRVIKYHRQTATVFLC
jgi:hypothetical protein